MTRLETAQKAFAEWRAANVTGKPLPESLRAEMRTLGAVQLLFDS